MGWSGGRRMTEAEEDERQHDKRARDIRSNVLQVTQQGPSTLPSSAQG